VSEAGFTTYLSQEEDVPEAGHARPQHERLLGVHLVTDQENGTGFVELSH
jgi:hypothetical protein